MTEKKKSELTNEELLAANAELHLGVKWTETAYESLKEKINDTLNQVRLLEKKNEQSNADAVFERDRANALEQRLQRMSGYLDRVMDEENQYKEPPTEVVKAIPAPKGPLIHDVALPVRRDSTSDALNAFPHVTRTLNSEEKYPRRTY